MADKGGINWAKMAAKNLPAQKQAPADFYYVYEKKAVTMNNLQASYDIDGQNWVQADQAENGSISFGPFPSKALANVNMDAVAHITIVPDDNVIPAVNNVHWTPLAGDRTYIYQPNQNGPLPGDPEMLRKFHKVAFYSKVKMQAAKPKAVGVPAPVVDPFPPLGKVVKGPPVWAAKVKK